MMSDTKGFSAATNWISTIPSEDLASYTTSDLSLSDCIRKNL